MKTLKHFLKLILKLIHKIIYITKTSRQNPIKKIFKKFISQKNRYLIILKAVIKYHKNIKEKYQIKLTTYIIRIS